MTRELKTKVFLIIFFSAIPIIYCGLLFAQASKPVHLSIASFKSGSGWFIMAQAMSRIIEKDLPKNSVVDVMPYSGGVGNPLLLHQGKVDLALGFPVETGLAIRGEPPYKEPIKELRLLVGRLDTYWFVFAVRKDTELTSFEMIKEKRYPLRLAVMPKGSSGEWMTTKVLKAYGITYEDIKAWGGRVTHTSFPTALEMMKDGQADAFGQVCTPGHPAWTQLATMVKLNFLPISRQIAQRFIDKYGYQESLVPKGAFRGIDKDVPVLGFYTCLITTDKLPSELAYSITKAICSRKDELVATYKGASVFDPRKAWDTPIPLHPGALKYYKELGYK